MGTCTKSGAVLLPDVENYEPTNAGESTVANIRE